MKVLITGANGFVGRYLVQDCLQAGWKVVGQDLHPAEGTYTFNILDSDSMRQLLRDERPDACVHLAGISYVPDGVEMAEKMLSVNLMGTVKLLEAFHAELPGAQVLVVSSANIYQAVSLSDGLDKKIDFSLPSMYSISKLAADLATLTYARDRNMNTLTVRPVNHIGPGQSDRFVVPSFARQLKMIALKGADPEIRVGNLKSRRDFLDVRDVVRAYRLLIEKGQSGHHYDLSSGRLMPVGKILSELCSISGVSPRIVQDSRLFRPTDSLPLLDSVSIHHDTGWEPRIDLGQTLLDIYNKIEI